MRLLALLLILVLTFFGCQSSNADESRPRATLPTLVTNVFQENYDQLPEALIVANEDSTVLAQYINPTEKYRHAILGDAIEAEGLLVYANNRYFEVQLNEDLLFEDLAPRLVDVTNDNIPELICIRTHVDEGAGLVIYQIAADTLLEYAWVEEVGRRNRWLNPAAIADLDDDGQKELAWVQTPHIGGILKVAEIEPGELIPADELIGPSNHGLQERNLCLSALVRREGELQLILPAQSREAVLFYAYLDGEIDQVGDSILNVDFEFPLYEQLAAYPFLVDGNCR